MAAAGPRRVAASATRFGSAAPMGNPQLRTHGQSSNPGGLVTHSHTHTQDLIAIPAQGAGGHGSWELLSSS